MQPQGNSDIINFMTKSFCIIETDEDSEDYASTGLKDWLISV